MIIFLIFCCLVLVLKSPILEMKVKESFVIAYVEWSASISRILLIALVITQAGYKSSSSSSEVTLDVTLSQIKGSGTTFPLT